LACVLDVSRALKNPGQSYEFSVELTLPEYEIAGDTVQFSNVKASGSLVSGEDDITARGTATATLSAHCARCLEAVSMDVETEFEVLFALTSDDPDVYKLDNHSIEMEDPVQDALLLEIPMRFLCSEECKGLCPTCGHNLNEGPCTCQEGDEVTTPFSALRNIVQVNKEV